MDRLTKGALWRRLDDAGAEQVLVSDHVGLHARGTMVAAGPVPLVCRYELSTDDNGVTVRFEATVEGPGFVRTARLQRAVGSWRVTASEQGDLDATLRRVGRPGAGLAGVEDPGRLINVLDVDLAYSPLTNSLPVRRLGLLEAAPGTTHTIDVAWVLIPSLEVVEATQSYTALGAGKVRFTSGSFTAEITFDPDGYVRHYPGLAERAA